MGIRLTKGETGAGAQAKEQILEVEVGAVIVATGFDSYVPEAGEFGYGMDGVVTLPDFKRLVDEGQGELVYQGRPVGDVAYVYCVGSRQTGDGPPDGSRPHEYCSRYCCAATAHTALRLSARAPGVHQYHLYRDIRTYGKFELLYSEAREQGSAYLKFPDDEPPAIERDGATGRLKVTTRDLLSEGESISIPVDLVVLVTGMVPRSNADLVRTLKLPVGKDGFFNEIHPKLRPVETVVDGLLICGTCQGPKTAAESTASGLAAVAQAAAILKQGSAELEPLIATVDPDVCAGSGACLSTCPYSAISTISMAGRDVAAIDPALCKGCGACVPACPTGAINLQGYTDHQVRAMIDGMLEAVS